MTISRFGRTLAGGLLAVAFVATALTGTTPAGARATDPPSLDVIAVGSSTVSGESARPADPPQPDLSPTNPPQLDLLAVV